MLPTKIVKEQILETATSEKVALLKGCKNVYRIKRQAIPRPKITSLYSQNGDVASILGCTILKIK